MSIDRTGMDCIIERVRTRDTQTRKGNQMNTVQHRRHSEIMGERIQQLEEKNAALLHALEQLLYFHDTDDTPNSDPWADARRVVAEMK
jgi:hypothetical protein